MKNLILSFLAFGFISCQGIEFKETPRNTLKPVDNTGISDIDSGTRREIENGLSPAEFFADDSSFSSSPTEPSPIGACDYIRELRDEYKARPRDYKKFQLFSFIQDQEVDGKTQLTGIMNLSANPQVLYKTSAEANKGASRFDMPDFEEFMAKAKKAYEDGELSWTKYTALKKMYDWGWTEMLAEKRNEAVLDKFDEGASGSVTGRPRLLSKSELVKVFFENSRHYSNIDDVNESDVASFGWWLHSLPLFSKNISLANDWARAIRVVNNASTANATDVSFAEEACLFVLVQRMSAQVLSQKGFEGSAALNSQGLLFNNFPNEEIVKYPVKTYEGSWKVPLSGAVITQYLGQMAVLSKRLEENSDDKEAQKEMAALLKTMRSKHAQSTGDFLNSFRAWAILLSARRTTGIWETLNATPKMPRLSSELLKLAVGIYAMHAPILAAEELTVSPSKRLSFEKDDSTFNLLRLGHLALATVWGLEGLIDSPSDLDKAVLSDAQREMLAKKDPTSAKGKLRMLTDGLMLEFYSRVAEGKITRGTPEFGYMIQYFRKTAYVLRAPNLLARIERLESGLALNGEDIPR